MLGFVALWLILFQALDPCGFDETRDTYTLLAQMTAGILVGIGLLVRQAASLHGNQKKLMPDRLLKQHKSYRSYITKETCFEILAVPGAREAITRVIYQLEQHERDINEVKKNTCQSLLELEEEFLDVAEHASEIPIPWGSGEMNY